MLKSKLTVRFDKTDSSPILYKDDWIFDDLVFIVKQLSEEFYKRYNVLDDIELEINNYCDNCDENDLSGIIIRLPRNLVVIISCEMLEENSCLFILTCKNLETGKSNKYNTDYNVDSIVSIIINYCDGLLC